MKLESNFELVSAHSNIGHLTLIKRPREKLDKFNFEY